jgi:hypothetical protein
MRKQGKKLAVYDLKLVITWIGTMSGGSKPVEGVVKISEFATETDEDDWVLECSTTETCAHAVRCQTRSLYQMASWLHFAASAIHVTC